MGKVISYLKRPFINYAIEAKTERLMKKLESEKPKPHPLYPTEQRILKELRKEHPEVLRKIKEKSAKLDDLLRHVKVKSQDLLPESDAIRRSDPKKLTASHPSLEYLGVPPEHREESRLKTDFGLPDPPEDRIPPGKISFRQAVKLLQIASSNENEDMERVEGFADEKFRFEPAKTRLLLKYFQPFAFSTEYERVRKITQSERAQQGPTFAEHNEEMESYRLRADQERLASYKRVDNIRRHMKASADAGSANTSTDDSKSSLTNDKLKSLEKIEQTLQKEDSADSTSHDISQNHESLVHSPLNAEPVGRRRGSSAQPAEQTDSLSGVGRKSNADSDSVLPRATPKKTQSDFRSG